MAVAKGQQSPQKRDHHGYNRTGVIQKQVIQEDVHDDRAKKREREHHITIEEQ